jgi:hypothetical protein
MWAIEELEPKPSWQEKENLWTEEGTFPNRMRMPPTAFKALVKAACNIPEAHVRGKYSENSEVLLHIA